jgi:hypothetical protein
VAHAGKLRDKDRHLIKEKFAVSVLKDWHAELDLCPLLSFMWLHTKIYNYCLNLYRTTQQCLHAPLLLYDITKSERNVDVEVEAYPFTIKLEIQL